MFRHVFKNFWRGESQPTQKKKWDGIIRDRKYIPVNFIIIKQNNQSKDQQEQGKKQNKEGEADQENKNQNTKSQDNGNTGTENKGKGNNGKIPNQQNQNQQNSNQLPEDLQQLILQRSANQERETARNLQNKKAYSMPESNEKDW